MLSIFKFLQKKNYEPLTISQIKQEILEKIGKKLMDLRQTNADAFEDIEEILRSVPSPLLAVFCPLYFMNEVRNGGLSLFYYNTQNKYSFITMTSLLF